MPNTQVYLGTDIVYMPRIEAAVSRFGQRFLDRVYTEVEQQDCLVESHRRRNKITCLAGRWAAKEAVVKALGTGWGKVHYKDIEIRRLPSGAPQVSFSGAAQVIVESWGNCSWQVSITHDQDYCSATAISLLFNW